MTSRPQAPELDGQRRVEALERAEDRLRESRIGLDGVEQYVDRDSSANRERELADPFARLGADRHRADEDALVGIGRELQNARALRAARRSRAARPRSGTRRSTSPSSSIVPTEATCGSVKTAAGIAR